MIVSHKHKFIFVKTHKTSTQTFLKFIKPHLGPNDVMAGDASNEVNEDTKINVDKVFESTGKSASFYQETYGNHLPWFMIKEITGDEIWDEYTKFTIERNPYDRLLSLFYFTHPLLTRIKIGSGMNPDYRDQLSEFTKEKRDEIIRFNQETFLTAYPEAVRAYFEDWLIAQLETTPLDLKDHKTYGVDAWSKEIRETRKTAEKFKLDKFLKMYKAKKVFTNPDSNLDYMNFEYTDDNNYALFSESWEGNKKMGRENKPCINGQCRLLDFGYYYDGNKITVDHVVDFGDVANGIGRVFKKNNIKINCNKKLYDSATQNAHYRKHAGNKKPQDWWYSGNKGSQLKKIINRIFFTKFSPTTVNLNDILI